MRSFLAVLLLILGLGLSLPAQSQAQAQAQAQAQWNSGEMIVDARLISDRASLAPGDSFYIGLHQIMPEGWHTYWRNPGDNGLPVVFEWDLPPGVEIGEIAWPAPAELPLADTIMDYGYKDEVTLPMPVRLTEAFSGEVVDLAADVTWLVCEEICVPEEERLTLSIPVTGESTENGDHVWYIRAALNAVPVFSNAIAGEIGLAADRVLIALAGAPFDNQENWRDLKVFPHESGLIRHAASPQISVTDGVTVFATEPGFMADRLAAAAGGAVIAFEARTEQGWEARIVEIALTPGNPPAPAMALAEPAPLLPVGQLLTILLLAVGGGLILNLMPCVFPVLSIKVLHVVEGSHGHPGRAQRDGLLFLAGVLASFVGLALILVLLRDFGLPVGWGFQLQIPIVVALLAMLFFAIGLNLLGAFEVGTSVQGLGSSLTQGDGAKSAFFTGVLAVVVAAPCVGPLAAGALGLALTQPAWVMVLISAALGFGLALPFVVLAFSPALMRFLPRPGPWMDTFKQALAFPMFASVVWLVWVLSIQSGSQAVLYMGLAMLGLSLAVWAARKPGMIARIVTIAAALATISATVWVARVPAMEAQQVAEANVEAWSDARVQELQQGGEAIFVDVTAAWCVTCQVNKIRVLNTEPVQAAFAELGVTLMRADWTNRNAEIASLIARHGQAGVPLYLVYPADGGPAEVLPTVLTRDIVVDAITAAAG